MIEHDGVDAFTMRGLAEQLGVAVTSIYWHVGGRDKLLDSLVERLVGDMAALPADADDPPSASPPLPAHSAAHSSTASTCSA